MLFQPRAGTGCTSLSGEDTGLMLTSSSQDAQSALKGHVAAAILPC